MSTVSDEVRQARTGADPVAGADLERTGEEAARRSPNAQARATHARSVHLLAAAMLRWGMCLAGPSSLITVAIATLLAGKPGLVGAGFGVALGFGSALVTITMMRMAAHRPPSSLLGFALGGYAVKMTALLLVMLLLNDVDSFSHPALACGTLVSVVVWAGAEVVAFLRTKTPVIVPSAPSVPVEDHTDG